MTITFDTLAQAKRLREVGFTEEQAEALTFVVRDAAHVDTTHLATKADLAELKTDLLKWIISLILSAVALNVGAVFGLIKLTGS